MNIILFKISATIITSILACCFLAVMCVYDDLIQEVLKFLIMIQMVILAVIVVVAIWTLI